MVESIGDRGTMDQRQLATLVLRAAGIFAWIRGFERVDWLVAWLEGPSVLVPMDPTVGAVAGLIPVGLLVLGTLLFVFAPRLAGLMTARPGGEPDRPVTSANLFATATAVIGVVLVVMALQKLVLLAAHLTEPAVDAWTTETLRASSRHRAILLVVQVILELGAGVGLFLGGGALWRIWRRLRGDQEELTEPR